MEATRACYEAWELDESRISYVGLLTRRIGSSRTRLRMRHGTTRGCTPRNLDGSPEIREKKGDFFMIESVLRWDEGRKRVSGAMGRVRGAWSLWRSAYSRPIWHGEYTNNTQSFD